MKHLLSRIGVLAALVALGATGSAVAQVTSANPAAIVQGTTDTPGVDLIAGTPGFHIFSEAVAAAGLLDMLRQPGPYTIFAPTDAAFARMPQGLFDSLMRSENRNRLREILQYHVVPSAVVADDIRNQQTLATVLGESLVVKKTATGAFTVNGANILQRDVVTGNGDVQVIDSVLLPNRRTPTDVPKNATQ